MNDLPSKSLQARKKPSPPSPSVHMVQQKCTLKQQISNCGTRCQWHSMQTIPEGLPFLLHCTDKRHARHHQSLLALLRVWTTCLLQLWIAAWISSCVSSWLCSRPKRSWSRAFPANWLARKAGSPRKPSFMVYSGTRVIPSTWEWKKVAWLWG